jgi:Spy/CpxP family protein refolding chaperone
METFMRKLMSERGFGPAGKVAILLLAALAGGCSTSSQQAAQPQSPPLSAQAAAPNSPVQQLAAGQLTILEQQRAALEANTSIPADVKQQNLTLMNDQIHKLGGQ